jgi:hypothetical protein
MQSMAGLLEVDGENPKERQFQDMLLEPPLP